MLYKLQTKKNKVNDVLTFQGDLPRWSISPLFHEHASSKSIRMWNPLSMTKIQFSFRHAIKILPDTDCFRISLLHFHHLIVLFSFHHFKLFQSKVRFLGKNWIGYYVYLLFLSIVCFESNYTVFVHALTVLHARKETYIFSYLWSYLSRLNKSIIVIIPDLKSPFWCFIVNEVIWFC